MEINRKNITNINKLKKLQNDIKIYNRLKTEFIHSKLERELNQYSFKKLWKIKCSKYNQNLDPDILPKVPRIIVIGDVHGDWNRTIKALKIAKLINDNDHWIGGNTVVVQVGDQIDRCRYNSIPCNTKSATVNDEGNDMKILKYFTNLHHQAKQYGGAVYSLLGNHELMNVQQNLTYVSYEGLNEFNNYITNKGNIIKNGKDARLWAFKTGNDMSEYLACTRKVAIIIGSNLFVHAGILPNIAKKYNVNSINKIMALYLWNVLKNTSKYKDIISPGSYSPLWNRVIGKLGLNSNNIDDIKNLNGKSVCAKIMKPLRQIYNVGKIYVGHTPVISQGITNVCNKQIWLTDNAISQAFDIFFPSNTKRKIQVLEILNDGEIINILSDESV
jgi:hypothetical protein